MSEVLEKYVYIYPIHSYFREQHYNKFPRADQVAVQNS